MKIPQIPVQATFRIMEGSGYLPIAKALVQYKRTARSQATPNHTHSVLTSIPIIPTFNKRIFQK